MHEHSKVVQKIKEEHPRSVSPSKSLSKQHSVVGVDVEADAEGSKMTGLMTKCVSSCCWPGRA